MSARSTEVLVTQGGAEVARRTCEPGEYCIGREPDCDIRIESEQISRHHAKLILHVDSAEVQDLGSSNGTFLNEKKVVGAMPVKPGDKVQIGDATLEVLWPAVSVTEALQRLLPPEALGAGKYTVGEEVARGGMGAILGAREATIDRTVAMKVMLGCDATEDVVRFVAEAKVTGQLEHPNIVPVHELGLNAAGQVFYTMKFVKGVTLRSVLDRLATHDASTTAKYPLPHLLTIFQKICDALAFAHSKGVVHRDLKPDNIMLGDFGEVLVMDWGLAKVIRRKDRNKKKEAKPPPALMRCNQSADKCSSSCTVRLSGRMNDWRTM